MGTHKVNTTAYHPQTDGLVERFNRTLIDMIAKSTDSTGRDGDICLPFLLFAYRGTTQASTGELPFLLLYCREAALNSPMDRGLIALDDYKTLTVVRMTEAWQLVKDRIEVAQKQQKTQNDRRARPSMFEPGDRAFMYMQAARSGKAYKLARSYHGPYHVITSSESTVEVRPVDRPNASSIHVALDRIRVCIDEIPDVFWPRKTCPSTETTDTAKDMVPQTE